MKDLIFSVNAVLPLFLCCAVGYFLKRVGLVEERFVKSCTNVVYYVAIPSNILQSILSFDIRASFDPGLVIFVVCAITGTALLLALVVPLFIRDRKTASTVIVDMFRGNFAILGIPLAISLLGQEGVAPTMILVPFGVLCYNVLTVVIFVIFTNDVEGGTKGVVVRTAFLKAIKNPLTIAAVLSIVLAFFSVDLPVVIDNTVEKFANMCTGLALLMLGTQFDFSAIRKRLRYSIPTIIVRLVLIPLVIVTLAFFLGFRGPALIAIYIFFSAPSAVNCFVLADCMGGDKDIASDAVLLTSCASIVTLVVGVYLLRSLSLF